MTASSKTKILLINAEGTHQDDVSAHLSRNSGFALTRTTPDQLPIALSGEDVDVVVVDLSKLESEETQLLTEVRGQDPHIPLIVISHDLGSDAMRQLFKFNVQDWLHKPIDGKELINSIASSVRSNKANNNRVHAVISAVGGAGASTLAVTMADIAASRLFKKKASVALFDLDFSVGNAGYLLNMINDFDLGSVVASPRRIDSEFIRVIQQRHENGFYLYSFKRPEMNTEMNGYELVLRLLDAVSLEHNHTFLDVPYYETDWKDDVLSAVNTCTVVTENNLPALKHTLDLITRVKTLRGADFPVHVLVNKHESSLFGGRISKSRLRELFGDTPFSFVPLEASLISEAADRGALPSEISSRNAFTKSLTKYLKSIELKAETVS